MSLLRSLLYVSKSTLVLPDEERRVQDIVSVSNGRNAALGITGALLFTELNFAQLLEGEAAAVETLMASIRRDERHVGITILQDQMITGRVFPSWSLAYTGPALFVGEAFDNYDRGLMARGHAAAEIFRLMSAFAPS